MSGLLSAVLQQLEGALKAFDNKKRSIARGQVNKIGLMAERLGKGLQNLVQRFDSASDLDELAL